VVRVEGEAEGAGPAASSPGALVGDVTGDGIQDVVATAGFADAPGLVDAGAIYVFAGSATPAAPPTATLRSAPLVAGDFLSGGAPPGIQLADVTGDGILDVIASAPSASGFGTQNGGAVFVYRGGPTLLGALGPTARLSSTAPALDDQLGLSSGQGVVLADVSGDGVLDLVVGARLAGLNDAGNVSVWFGGASLVGAPPPTAVLANPLAVQNDQLGEVSGQGIQVADVTGDGLLDIVVGARMCDVSGVDAGAIFVWASGPLLVGTPPPTAVLSDGNAPGGQLGSGSVDGFLLEDVTGDGIRDVVTSAPQRAVGLLGGAGGGYVWEGGATLAGTPLPRATLLSPIAMAGDNFGMAVGTPGIQVADVTGDGVGDVIATTSGTDFGGLANVGSCLVWTGGATLTGAAPPRAILRPPVLFAQDQMGVSGGNGVLLRDVTGDGVKDVVVASMFADVGAVADAGTILVWAGGTTLVGQIPPLATLQAAHLQAFDQLTSGKRAGLSVAEVTGDGVLDVIAVSPLDDLLGIVDAGTVHVFAGGAAMSGTPGPRAILYTPTAAFGPPNLGLLGASPGFALGDVSGDGVIDILAVSPLNAATLGVHVWFGGAGLLPLAPSTIRLTPTDPNSPLGLGLGCSGTALRLADVTGDGILDVLLGFSDAQVGGIASVGTVSVWAGGSLAGAPPPQATLRHPTQIQNDRFGTASGDGIVLGDVNGDGVTDVIGLGSAIDLVVVDAGAIDLWHGGALLVGVPPPTGTHAVPTAVAGDQLGGN